MASYTVKKGESWASIARDELGNERAFQELMQANSGGFMLRPGMSIRLPDQVSKNPFVSNELAASVGMATSGQVAGAYNTPGGLQSNGKMAWTPEQGQYNQLWASQFARGDTDPLDSWGNLPQSFMDSLGKVGGTGTSTSGMPGISSAVGGASFAGGSGQGRRDKGVGSPVRGTTPSRDERSTSLYPSQTPSQTISPTPTYNPKGTYDWNKADFPNSAVGNILFSAQDSKRTAEIRAQNQASGTAFTQWEESMRVGDAKRTAEIRAQNKPYFDMLKAVSDVLTSDSSYAAFGTSNPSSTMWGDFYDALTKNYGYGNTSKSKSPGVYAPDATSEKTPVGKSIPGGNPEIETANRYLTGGGAASLTSPVKNGDSIADLLAQYGVGQEAWKLDWMAVRKGASLTPWGYSRDYVDYYNNYGGGGSSGGYSYGNQDLRGSVNMKQADG